MARPNAEWATYHRIAILSASGLLILFTILAAAVGHTAGPLPIDEQLVALVAPLRGSIDDPMRVATYLCSWQVIVTIAVLLVTYLGLERLWRPAATIVVALIGDQVIVLTIKHFMPRLRPDQALAIMPATGSSFPSGHTLIGVVFYGTLAFLLASNLPSNLAKLLVGLLAVAVALAVGFSRVYLGAHWPSDVLGSFLIGSAWLTTVRSAYRGSAAPVIHGD